MRRVVVLADGGAEAGLGHVSRASGLAAALEERGVEVSSVVLEVPDPVGSVAGLDAAEAIVLDSYRVAPRDLPTAAPVAAFHDYGEAPVGAALVIDGSNPQHACLREPFWDLPAREIAENVAVVVVATGAGGRFGEYAGHVRQALPAVTVLAVRGPYAKGDPPDGVEVLDAPDSLADVLVKADLAVLGAGQTMLEAAAAGTPSIAVPLVENQRRQAERLAELGAVVLAEPGAVGEQAAALAADSQRRHELSARAQAAVDGQGARRVAALVEQLA